MLFKYGVHGVQSLRKEFFYDLLSLVLLLQKKRLRKKKY